MHERERLAFLHGAARLVRVRVRIRVRIRVYGSFRLSRRAGVRFRVRG